jgi:hypothetical protein
MKLIQKSTMVNGRPQEAFAYLTDVTRHMEWAKFADGAGLVEIRPDGPLPLKPGSTFRSVGREEAFTMRDVSTVTALEAPHTFQFETVSAMGLFRMRYSHWYGLHAQGEGTFITYTVRPRFGNLASRLLWPIIAMSAKKSEKLVEKGLGRFKAAFEAQASTQREKLGTPYESRQTP